MEPVPSACFAAGDDFTGFQMRLLSRVDWLRHFWAWLTGAGLTGVVQHAAPQSVLVEATVLTARLDSSAELRVPALKPGLMANSDWKFAVRLRAVAEANVPTSRKSPGARERRAVSARSSAGVTASIAAQQALRFVPPRATEAHQPRAGFVSYPATGNVVALRHAQHLRPAARRGFVDRLAA